MAALPTRMRQARIHPPGDLRIDEVPLAPPEADEVVVRIAQAGIAGTDLKFFSGDLRPQAYPQGVGGAGTGTIVAAGDQVTRVAVGDRVLALGPGGCGKCARCRQGHGAYCLQRQQPMKRRGACFAEYITLGEFQAVPITLELSDDQITSLPTVSLAGHVQSLFGYGAGDHVVVVGSGTVGWGQVAQAAMVGARVAALEFRPERRDTAKSFGAELALDPREPGAIEEVQEWSEGVVEYVVDAACTVESQRMIFDMVAPGGSVALLGRTEWEIPAPWIVHRSLRLYGCRGGDDIPMAAALVRSGKMNLSTAISHRFPLADLPAGYELLADPSNGALGSVMNP